MAGEGSDGADIKLHQEWWPQRSPGLMAGEGSSARFSSMPGARPQRSPGLMAGEGH